MIKNISVNAIVTLPINNQGTDYVVGDLHGCYQLLQDLLDKVNFDPACDRLISVGDLIDRGPDSLACLQLLAEPWFYAVRGNHEAMLANFFANYRLNDTQPNDELDYWFNLGKLGNLDGYSYSYSVSQKFMFLDNGGDWIMQYYDFERQRMTPEFDQALARVFSLPLIIVVGTGDTRFQVVHAELLRNDLDCAPPTTWLDEDIDRWSMGEAIPEHTVHRMLWGRTLFRKKDLQNQTPMQPGLSPTYCGHTLDTNVRSAFSHICIDTGAFLTQPPYQTIDQFYLTLYNTQKQQAIQIFQIPKNF
ncbi:MAG: hypothetical protein HOP02_03200 [Methylococcaceae bacterium]|nr:hypothetical protein [Methylococcaceae bacterium]